MGKFKVGDKVVTIHTKRPTNWRGFDVGQEFEIAEVLEHKVITKTGEQLWLQEIELSEISPQINNPPFKLNPVGEIFVNGKYLCGVMGVPSNFLNYKEKYDG